MSMFVSPLLWLILVCIGVGLIFFLYSMFTSNQRKTPQKKIEGKCKKPALKGKPGSAGVCPVCGTIMKKNEKLNTKIYPGEGDRLCSIYGCPHCYPVVEQGRSRKCPVCKESVPPELPLIAQLFERANSRHVHILGCRHCRGGV